MEDETMARQIPTAVNQPVQFGVSWHGSFTTEQRETMIREAAYYHYVQRGYTAGHDLDDWLAAEAELNHGTPTESLAEYEVQQSSVHGAAADDELKRMVRQHPQKAIPRVESVEPKDAPPKE
jgi:hypothetical protein